MRKLRIGFSSIIAIALLVAPAALASAQEDGTAAAPAPFSGLVGPGLEVPGGRSLTVLEMSDPRLDGTVYWSNSGWVADAVEYGWQTFRIVNADGAWQGSFPDLYADGAEPRSSSITTGHLVGEGLYDGLVAITEIDSNHADGWDLRGYVVDASTLPAPPPPAGTE